jgi:cytochrome c oxidase cbb3-type subunit III
MTSAWSWFIVILTLANIAAVVWLLQATASSRKPTSDDGSTGHRWDGDLTELNRPLPRWWYRLFLGSCVWGVGYLLLYPGLGSFRGFLGWDQKSQHAAEADAAARRQAPRYARFAAMTLDHLAQDPDAMATARSLFANSCTACHGSDGRGARGFPDLTDGDWLYGNEPETLVATIANGRAGVMPAWQAVLGGDGVAEIVAYLRAVRGEPMSGAAGNGAAKFATYCVACHGADGTGNRVIGAPNLTDSIWLYGGDAETLGQSVAAGRNGQMPAYRDAMGDDRVRLLAAFVLSLSQSAVAAPKPEPAHALSGGE